MADKEHPLQDDQASLEVRLDKWLHASRLYKTRTLATEMIEGGRVTYNGKRTKPSRLVEVGALITLHIGSEIKTIRVEALSNKRTCYSIAKNNYQETDESIMLRQQRAQERQLTRNAYLAPATKPNKKDRRKLVAFKSKRYQGDDFNGGFGDDFLN